MELINNSKDMATIVETFLTEETIDLIYDNDKLDQWNKKIEELGLAGQKRIKTKECSPIPFMHLKSSLKNIFDELCPMNVNVDNYDLTPIPLEVLDLIALSKREGYFEKIKIQYDDKAPDPCVIGINYGTYYSQNDDGSLKQSFTTKIDAQNHMDENGWTKHKPYGTNERYYLIAKWGDVKRSFDELKNMAHKRFIERESVRYKQQLREAQRGLDDLEEIAFNRFN